MANLTGRWGDDLKRQIETYEGRFPGRFYTFANVDWRGVGEPGFGERAEREFEESVRAGARGLKVFKNLGLQVRDRSGSLLRPDDERLDALWAKAGELGVPVLIHVADPAAFFEPLDPTNDSYLELKKHPDWHFYGPGIPTFRELIEAGIALMARHPQTTFITAHTGWYTENLRGVPLSQGFSRLAYREQHFDCLACHVAAQHRAGIDIFVDGDTRLDDDVAGRAWVSYVTERIAGIGTPRVEVPPAGFMADKGPGDLMWEVIETRMTPPVTGKIGDTALQLDRAYKAIAPMTERPVKVGSISAQILALMLTNEHYKNRLDLLMDLSIALNKEYHALADAGAPLVQIEEPAIHQVIADPKQAIKPEQWVEAFNIEVKGLRKKCEVWCHTCWGSPAAQRVASKDQSYKAALPYLDQLDVDVLTIEGAFNRGMDFEHVGKMISKDKKIAVGVISHRTLQVERPEEVADLIRQGDIALIINTPLGKTSHYDEKAIRKAALQFNVPCVTTITGAEALVEAISTKQSQDAMTVRSLQEIHSPSGKAAEQKI
jgi:5-methyltetrahydropteroyltriglutamate--homocysteine methyltransferase